MSRNTERDCIAKFKNDERIYEDNEVSGVDRRPSPLGNFIMSNIKKNNEQVNN